MMKIVKLVKSRQDVIAQQLLNQVDNVGCTLNQLGVKNNVNRHTLIGNAFVQKYRLEGELVRFDLLIHNSLAPIKKVQTKVDATIDDAIDYLPGPLAKRAHRTHNSIKRLLGR